MKNRRKMLKDFGELVEWRDRFYRQLAAYGMGAGLSCISLAIAYFYLPAGEARWPLLALLALLFGSLTTYWSARFENTLWKLKNVQVTLKDRKPHDAISRSELF